MALRLLAGSWNPGGTHHVEEALDAAAAVVRATAPGPQPAVGAERRRVDVAVGDGDEWP